MFAPMRWTPEETALLQKHYLETNSARKLLGELPGRTEEAIKLQARKLGLQQKQNPDAWSAEDDGKIRVLYPRGKNADLLAAFPGRNLTGIRKRACRLGVERELREDLPEVKAAHAQRLRERPLRLGTSKSPIEVRDGVEGRVCNKCNDFRPIGKFALAKRGPGGRRITCTTCEGRAAYQSNPQRCRGEAKLHQARIRAGGGKVTLLQLKKLIGVYDAMCGYCEVAPYEHIDHKLPLARGGKHEIENLIPACATCNLRKNKMTYDEFLAKFPELAKEEV